VKTVEDKQMREVLTRDVRDLLLMTREYKKGVEIIEATHDEIIFNILNEAKRDAEILLRVKIFYNKELCKYCLKESDKITWIKLMDSLELDYHTKEAVRDIEFLSETFE
jgi:hypothetical protein